MQLNIQMQQKNRNNTPIKVIEQLSLLPYLRQHFSPLEDADEEGQFEVGDDFTFWICFFRYFDKADASERVQAFKLFDLYLLPLKNLNAFASKYGKANLAKACSSMNRRRNQAAKNLFGAGENNHNEIYRQRLVARMQVTSCSQEDKFQFLENLRKTDDVFNRIVTAGYDDPSMPLTLSPEFNVRFKVLGERRISFSFFYSPVTQAKKQEARLREYKRVYAALDAHNFPALLTQITHHVKQIYAQHSKSLRLLSPEETETLAYLQRSFDPKKAVVENNDFSQDIRHYISNAHNQLKNWRTHQKGPRYLTTTECLVEALYQYSKKTYPVEFEVSKVAIAKTPGSVKVFS